MRVSSILATLLVAGPAVAAPGARTWECDPRLRQPLPVAQPSVALFLVTAAAQSALPVEVGAIDARVRAEVEELGSFRVVDEGAAAASLAAFGLDPRACAGRLRCLAVVARALAAQYVLVPEIVGAGDERRLFASLLGARDLRAVARVVEDLPRDEGIGEALSVRRAVVRLLEPETYVGSLQLEAERPGAEVFLDGARVGTTPLRERLTSLVVGPHRLMVRSPGMAFERLVEVPFRREVRVVIDVAGRSLEVVESSLPPLRAGTVDLSSLEPGIEVRVDGDLVAVTSPLITTVHAAAGERRLSFRKSGLGTARLVLEVVPRHVHPVRVVTRGERLVVEASPATPGERPKPTRAAPGRELPHRLQVFLTATPSPRARKGSAQLDRASLERAVALTAYGYLANELRKVVRPPPREPPPRGAVARAWAEEDLVRSGGRTRLELDPWEWAALAAGTTAIIGGMGMMVRDLLDGSWESATDTVVAASLNGGLRLTYNGSIGWIRFRARF